MFCFLQILEIVLYVLIQFSIISCMFAHIQRGWGYFGNKVIRAARLNKRREASS